MSYMCACGRSSSCLCEIQTPLTAASGADREEVRADFWQDYADGHPDAVAYVAASGADGEPGWVHDPDDVCERPCCGPTLPASGADQPTLRDQLAEELARHSGMLGPRDPERPDVWFGWCDCGWDGGEGADGYSRRYQQHVADALLPLVEAHMERAKAEGGAEALDGFRRWLLGGGLAYAKVLRELSARAAALRGSTGGAR